MVQRGQSSRQQCDEIVFNCCLGYQHEFRKWRFSSVIAFANFTMFETLTLKHHNTTLQLMCLHLRVNFSKRPLRGLPMKSMMLKNPQSHVSDCFTLCWKIACNWSFVKHCSKHRVFPKICAISCVGAISQNACNQVFTRCHWDAQTKVVTAKKMWFNRDSKCHFKSKCCCGVIKSAVRNRFFDNFVHGCRHCIAQIQWFFKLFFQSRMRLLQISFVCWWMSKIAQSVNLKPDQCKATWLTASSNAPGPASPSPSWAIWNQFGWFSSFFDVLSTSGFDHHDLFFHWILAVVALFKLDSQNVKRLEWLVPNLSRED